LSGPLIFRLRIQTGHARTRIAGRRLLAGTRRWPRPAVWQPAATDRFGATSSGQHGRRHRELQARRRYAFVVARATTCHLCGRIAATMPRATQRLRRSYDKGASGTIGASVSTASLRTSRPDRRRVGRTVRGPHWRAGRAAAARRLQPCRAGRLGTRPAARGRGRAGRLRSGARAGRRRLHGRRRPRWACAGCGEAQGCAATITE
jgi:hypothetical protein